MRRSSFDETRDQVAADHAGPDPKLMCSARGCPNRRSTSVGQLCRWHADAEPERWPEVTQQMQWDETDRAQRRGQPQIAGRQFDAAEKRAILERLRTVLTEPKDERAWLHSLRRREAAGERLSAAQKHALHECRHIAQEGA